MHISHKYMPDVAYVPNITISIYYYHRLTIDVSRYQNLPKCIEDTLRLISSSSVSSVTKVMLPVKFSAFACLFWWWYSNLDWIAIYSRGAGIAQWLERRTHDWKVAGSNPCRSGGRIFFSRVNFLCWLLFWYPFHPCVTAVACKRSRSFCQKCRWQVTAKHAYTLCVRLCMKWHGASLYGVHRTCAETAAVLCGTSHASAVSTPLWWVLKTHYKKLVTRVESHVSVVSLLESGE